VTATFSSPNSLII
jgi:ribosomal protein S11